MACMNMTVPGQSLDQRRAEVRKAVTALEQALAMRMVKPVVGPQGAIAFQGWESSRARVTDVCAYRMVMAGNSASAKLAIMQAEQLAGRSVSREAIGQGTHSHDGGKTWGRH